MHPSIHQSIHASMFLSLVCMHIMYCICTCVCVSIHLYACMQSSHMKTQVHSCKALGIVDIPGTKPRPHFEVRRPAEDAEDRTGWEFTLVYFHFRVSLILASVCLGSGDCSTSSRSCRHTRYLLLLVQKHSRRVTKSAPRPEAP